MTNPLREKLLEAALPHVSFDGWGETSFCAASADAGIDLDAAHSLCPRGSLDLAMDFHRAGDAAMIGALADHDLGDLRFRDRVALAVKLRLENTDKEIVRRGAALFALPQYAPDGAQLIWGTADAIWTALGDQSRDANWYSKRATLSAVYGSTVLYWLGDDSADAAATWAFLDRRIENVMEFEKLKAGVKKIPGLGAVLSQLETGIRAPSARTAVDVPGYTTSDQKEEDRR